MVTEEPSEQGVVVTRENLQEISGVTEPISEMKKLQLREKRSFFYALLIQRSLGSKSLCPR